MAPCSSGAFAPGFASHPYGSQKAFRLALAAMASPAAPLEADFAGLFSGPPPLEPAAAALVLTLCDSGTGLWLSPSLAAAAGYFAFHAGARAAGPGEAAFAVAASFEEAPPLSALFPGTESRPELSATLIVSGALGGRGPGIAASGPGIPGRRILSGHSVPRSFVEERRAMEAMYPLGVDVFLTGEGAVCGLPRTTSLEPA